MGKNASTNPDRKIPEKSKQGNFRDRATIQRLKLYKTKPVRNSEGKILKNAFQSKELPKTRIAPNRRWFGNTRVISQEKLEQFKKEITKKDTPYNVLLRRNKIPMGLLDVATEKKVFILHIS